MGKTDLFTHFYPTDFTQWVKLTVPTLTLIIARSLTHSTETKKK